jgi:hypothetical protein
MENKTIKPNYKVNNTLDLNIEDKLNEVGFKFNETYDTKQPVSVAPTYTPKNFYEQIVLYVNGATIRLYVYVNGTWRYSALT